MIFIKLSLFNLYSTLETKHPFKYMNKDQEHKDRTNVIRPSHNGADIYIKHAYIGTVK